MKLFWMKLRNRPLSSWSSLSSYIWTAAIDFADGSRIWWPSLFTRLSATADGSLQLPYMGICWLPSRTFDKCAFDAFAGKMFPWIRILFWDPMFPWWIPPEECECWWLICWINEELFCSKLLFNCIKLFGNWYVGTCS